MVIFTLSEHATQSVERIIHDKKIDIDSVRQAFNYPDIDYDEMKQIITDAIHDHPCSMSLFSNDNTQLSNIVSAKRFLTYLEQEDEDDFLRYTQSDNYRAQDVLDILTGRIVIIALHKEFIRLSPEAYGFANADDMLYSLGAYLINAVHYSDDREVMCAPVKEDGQTLANVFEVHSHGDFRLTQYSLSAQTSTNPFCPDETLPFGFPKRVGQIWGYHSVEMSFFAALLNYAFLEGITVDCVDETETFLSVIKQHQQRYGAFADAGDYSKGFAALHFHNICKERLPNIPTEMQGHYAARIDNENLVFDYFDSDDSSSSVALTVTPMMVNGLIKGLFDKVNKGNGRSSVAELEEGLRGFVSLTQKK